MKNEKLLLAIGEIDPSIIEEAERVRRPRLVYLRRTAAAAACVCVIAASAIALIGGGEIPA